MLRFNGSVVGEMIHGPTRAKYFPPGVHYFLIEAHVRPQDTMWSDGLWTAYGETLEKFLVEKDATEVHSDFVAAIKKRGRAKLPNAMTGRYSAKKILRLLDRSFAFLYRQHGIRASLCKINVALDHKEHDVPRSFLWIELIDEAAAEGYCSPQAYGKKKRASRDFLERDMLDFLEHDELQAPDPYDDPYASVPADVLKVLQGLEVPEEAELLARAAGWCEENEPSNLRDISMDNDVIDDFLKSLMLAKVPEKKMRRVLHLHQVLRPGQHP